MVHKQFYPTLSIQQMLHFGPLRSYRTLVNQILPDGPEAPKDFVLKKFGPRNRLLLVVFQRLRDLLANVVLMKYDIQSVDGFENYKTPLTLTENYMNFGPQTALYLLTLRKCCSLLLASLRISSQFDGKKGI